MMLKAARRDGLIQDDPGEFVNLVKRENAESRRPFTLGDIKAILEVANGEWQSLIKFGLYTGQRLSDLVLLSWANVDLERNEIRLVTSKTGKMMLIPIADPLRRHILSLPASDDPKAPLHSRAYNCKISTLSNQFVDLLAAAGLRPRRQDKYPGRGSGKGRAGRRIHSGVSFHSLRHTAVTLLKDAGIPEAAVMELIGHDSKRMSALYTHVGREALEKAVAALPEI